MVRKNKTTFRSSLSMEGTLSPILTVKLADVNAVKFKPPSELLKKAKGATWENITNSISGKNINYYSDYCL